MLTDNGLRKIVALNIRQAAMDEKNNTKQFAIDCQSGVLTSARQCHSPNFDERPDAQQPELIVVHGISLPPGEFGGGFIEDLFCNRLEVEADPYFASIAHLRVSAHVLIRRDGEIVQFVPFTQRAWHAGESQYCGRNRCNDYSIGIELEGTDEMAYTELQYAALAALIAALKANYPSLAQADVVGHSDIAPGRKSDPGEAFEWPKLDAYLAAKQYTNA